MGNKNTELEWVVYYYLKPFCGERQTKWQTFAIKGDGEKFIRELKKDKNVIKIEPIKQYSHIYLKPIWEKQ